MILPVGNLGLNYPHSKWFPLATICKPFAYKKTLFPSQRVGARIIIGEFSIYRAVEIFCEVSIHHDIHEFLCHYNWYVQSLSKRFQLPFISEVRTRVLKGKLKLKKLEDVVQHTL